MSLSWQWKTISKTARKIPLRTLNAANDWFSFTDDDDREFNMLLGRGDVRSPAVSIQLTPDGVNTYEYRIVDSCDDSNAFLLQCTFWDRHNDLFAILIKPIQVRIYAPYVKTRTEGGLKLAFVTLHSVVSGEEIASRNVLAEQTWGQLMIDFQYILTRLRLTGPELRRVKLLRQGATTFVNKDDMIEADEDEGHVRRVRRRIN